MIDKAKKISVTNRDNATTVYTVQADNGAKIRRTFAPHQAREISFGELQALYWSKGGKTVLEQILRIDDQEAINELLGKVEPEYNYSAQDVKNLLLEGSLDALKDCLDFAPSSVVDLVKDYAISLEIDSESKRKAISEKTGVNIGQTIEMNREIREAEKQASGNQEIVTKIGERRVQPKIEEKSTGRRTELPKYTPIKK